MLNIILGICIIMVAVLHKILILLKNGLKKPRIRRLFFITICCGGGLHRDPPRLQELVAPVAGEQAVNAHVLAGAG